jgi:predicted NUDIX family phosphoesterase
MSQVQTINAAPLVKTERILVVKRLELFKESAWTGIKSVNFDEYLKLIQDKQEFMPRNLAEENFDYKQIIPYLVFQHQDTYFLMQRKSGSSEQRLANKYSLGIGGHLREEDMDGATLFDWARREFDEEINYSGNLEITPLGILNDDSNDVGKVHVGFVFLLKGDSADISIKSELQSGQLLTTQQCQEKYEGMETWSQLVFDFIKKSQ